MQIVKENIRTGEKQIVEVLQVRSRRECHAVREQLIRLNQQARPGIIYYAQ